MDQARPDLLWVWAADCTSGRAAWTCEWIAKAAVLTGQSPSTTSPWWLTRMRSDARISPNDMPNGFTQKQSGRSGSRAVRCPATPSLKPKRSKSRKAAAIRCLMWVRSSSGEENSGNVCGRGGSDHGSAS